MEKYVYLNKNRLKTYQIDDKLDESFQNKDEKEDLKSAFSKQKSLGSSSVILNNENIEKKNSRMLSTKNLFLIEKEEKKEKKEEKKDKKNKENKIMNNFLVTTRENRRFYNVEDPNFMKSSFTKKEIEEWDNKELDISIDKSLTTNISSNKLMLRNEFSNNIKSNWYLSKDLKKSLKKQEDKKKRRCMACKTFKIDTKACQCTIF